MRGFVSHNEVLLPKMVYNGHSPELVLGVWTIPTDGLKFVKRLCRELTTTTYLPLVLDSDKNYPAVRLCVGPHRNVLAQLSRVYARRFAFYPTIFSEQPNDIRVCCPVNVIRRPKLR